MTESQAIHLIEQFASQSPFAIWILDSRGVAIFANSKLHQMLGIKEKPSGAIGMNLFQAEGIISIGLGEVREKLKKGESINTTVEIPNLKEIATTFETTRTELLHLRIIGYALRSSAQKIEHYVIFLEDITETNLLKEELADGTKSVKSFLRSKKSRSEKLDELKKELSELESELKKRDEDPGF